MWYAGLSIALLKIVGRVVKHQLKQNYLTAYKMSATPQVI